MPRSFGSTRTGRSSGGTARWLAVAPLADAAGDADRLVGGVGLQVEVVGVDQGPGVRDLAAEADRVALHRRAEAAAGLGDVAGQAEVAHAVRRLGQLAQERPGVSKARCTFHSGQAPPKRANCSRVAEWRLVIVPAWSTRTKKNGMPLAPAALQRREPLRHLLERGLEALRQRLEVVAQRLRPLEEARVGQQRRAGEVVGEPGPADRPRRVGLEPGEVERRLEQVGVLDAARAGAGSGRPAWRRRWTAASMSRRGAGSNRRTGASCSIVTAMPCRARATRRAPPAGRRRPSSPATTLRRAVDGVDVVVAVVEEVAHLLPGQRRQARRPRAERLVQLRQPLLRLALRPVQRQEGAREVGALAATS